ncbi:MAG: M28 family peptidase [Thermoanaerobaculia bacterium]
MRDKPSMGLSNLERRSVGPGVLLLLAAALGCGQPSETGPGGEASGSGLPEGTAAAAEAISEASLRASIRFLADDLLEGRGPATRGDRLTRAYLASSMESLGLEPGGADGGWEQPFEIVGVTAEVPKEWTFLGGRRGVALSFWDDFVAASGVQDKRAAIRQAEVVFVGYGIQAPEYTWDDYKGHDLRGKVLLMLNNDPDWDPELFEGERRLYYGRWTYKYESAARQGAAGAIIIHTTPSAGYPYQVVQTSWTGEQFELPDQGEARVPIEAWVTEEAARKIVALAGQDLDALATSARSRDFEPVPLDVTTSLELENTISRVQTANVAGLLRGSDPELADEVVVYTAHHDHLGIGQPDATGDGIYNGARDNAAGVAQVLAIARGFARLPEPPRRSILFLFVAAEEQGLLGSEYYANHPTFAPGKITANINFDSPNIWGRTADISFLGYGKSTADRFVEAAADRQGRIVKGDQFPDRGYYYRSDQLNFARIGVPAIYLDPGTEYLGRPADWGHEVVEAYEARSYHQPSDELTEEWNLDGLVEDSRLGFMVGLAIAETDEPPVWKPGDEFEAARQEALSALREP